jgi:anti-sigma B factor antagonist
MFAEVLMSVKANVRRAGDVAIVDLSGRITLGEGTGLVRNTIKDLVNSGQKNILLNLKEVSYLDSSGLGEMVGAYATVTNAQGSIKLLHPQAKVHDLLQVTKLFTVFVTFDDEQEALRSYAAAASSNRLYL